MVEQNQNQIEQDTVAVPNRAVVATTRQETKAMVVNAITSVLSEARQSIGVSVKWLVKHTEQLALRQEEVEGLVSVRTEFGGKLTHAVKFLYRGLTVDEVCGCYRTQRAIVAQGDGKETNVSITMIAKLAQAFPEADPENEDLYDVILMAHEVIRKRYFWVRYVHQSIAILCAIAEAYECATIEAALAMVESRYPRESGVLAVDEGEETEDEVERQRADYEARRGLRR